MQSEELVLGCYGVEVRLVDAAGLGLCRRLREELPPEFVEAGPPAPPAPAPAPPASAGAAVAYAVTAPPQRRGRRAPRRREGPPSPRVRRVPGHLRRDRGLRHGRRR